MSKARWKNRIICQKSRLHFKNTKRLVQNKLLLDVQNEFFRMISFIKDTLVYCMTKRNSKKSHQPFFHNTGHETKDSEILNYKREIPFFPKKWLSHALLSHVPVIKP